MKADSSMPARETLVRLRQGLTAGLACALAAAALHFAGVLETLEFKTLDTRFKLRPATPADAAAAANVAIVAIDQDSLAYVSQRMQQGWPWPRAFYGKILRYLRDAGARAVVFDMFFTEPEKDRGDIPGEESDAEFAAGTRYNGRVYNAPVLVGRGLPPPPDKAAAFREFLGACIPAGEAPPGLQQYGSAALPAAELTRASRALGFADIYSEHDNIFRRVPLLARWQTNLVPGLAFVTAWDLEGRPPIRMRGSAVTLKDRSVPVDEQGRFFLWWYKPGPQSHSVFAYRPFAQVLSSAVQQGAGKKPELPAAVFSNKIVIVGSTAAGLMDVRATPLAKLTPGMEIQATALLNLLRGEYVTRLPAAWVVLPLLLVCALLGAAIRLQRNTFQGIAATLGLLALTLAAGALLLWYRRWFLDVIPLAVGEVGTFLVTLCVNYVAERRHSRLVRKIFEHYLDPSVVKELVAHPDRVKLGGERRNCTVLFTDLANSTAIASELPAEAVVSLINLYLDELTKIVKAEGGFVDKYVGDELVAVFGAPQALPDHAACATRAALRMRARMEELQPQFREMGATREVFNRTGINTGDVIVGNMGSEDRMNYTAMGDSMNVGARIQGVCKAYGVRLLAGPDGIAAAEKAGWIFREVDSVQVVGKTGGCRIFEPVGGPGYPLAEGRAERLAAYAEGLKHYRARRWDEAIERFTAAGEDDGPARVLSARCRACAANPPPPDWDGSHVMEGK